jgi:dynein heavy chain
MLTKTWLDKWRSWKTGAFSFLDPAELDGQASLFQKTLQKFGRGVKQWKVWHALFNTIQRFRQTMPLIKDLRSPAMRPRHWTQLQEEIQQQFDANAADFTLERVFNLGLHMYAEVIANLAGVAGRELQIETNLAEIAACWETQEVDTIACT